MKLLDFLRESVRRGFLADLRRSTLPIRDNLSEGIEGDLRRAFRADRETDRSYT